MFVIKRRVYGIEEKWDECMEEFDTREAAQDHVDWLETYRPNEFYFVDEENG